jgi:hypothetical protein
MPPEPSISSAFELARRSFEAADWLDGVAIRVTNDLDIEEGRAAAERMTQSLRAPGGQGHAA